MQNIFLVFNQLHSRSWKKYTVELRFQSIFTPVLRIISRALSKDILGFYFFFFIFILSDSPAKDIWLKLKIKYGRWCRAVFAHDPGSLIYKYFKNTLLDFFSRTPLTGLLTCTQCTRNFLVTRLADKNKTKHTITAQGATICRTPSQIHGAHCSDIPQPLRMSTFPLARQERFPPPSPTHPSRP